MQVWRRDNPDKALAALLRPYGVTVEWYREQEARQHGLCAICGQPETGMRNGKVKKLAVVFDLKGRILFMSNKDSVVSLKEFWELVSDRFGI
jgi:hypothetical protein